VVVVALVAGLIAVAMELVPLPWTPPAAELAYEIPGPRARPVITAASPTPDPALLTEITDAFQKYSDIRAEAEWSLDGSRLAEIIEHHVRVSRAMADEAEVVDDVTDWSVYVDAVTRQPLQPEPAGRQLTEVYFLRKIDGVWKVVGEG
jgi:hypothetical protein